MGWWSETVMGGDTPLDVEGTIYNDLGIKGPYEDVPLLIRKNAFIEHAKQLTCLVTPYGNIGAQVLGLIAMELGVPRNSNYIENILQDAKHSAIYDEWALENLNGERRKCMVAFVKVIDNYTGNPTQIESKSLFDVMEEHLNNKRSY